VRSSEGTQSGKGTAIVWCAPEAVCTSSMAARRSSGNRSATRTRRWPEPAVYQGDFPIDQACGDDVGGGANAVEHTVDLVTRWMAHQLPRIGSPTIRSARLGTGPCADCITTPCPRSQSSSSMGD
jgi:hypothetical protein